MKIACVSDLHGYLPEIPECDLVLIAGDVGPGNTRRFPHQIDWYLNEFSGWLKSIEVPVIGVAGNHDFALERGLNLPWTYLQDSGCVVDGLKFHGSPWQPEFGGWCFNAPEAELQRRWRVIPEDTDILLLHGPPYGYGDANDYGEHCGSPSLTQAIQAIQPKLAVYGHIHEGYGCYQLGESILVNASYVDESYFPVNPIQVIEL